MSVSRTDKCNLLSAWQILALMVRSSYPPTLPRASRARERVNQRVEKAVARFKELAESRTSDERIQEQLMEVLERWFVLGRTTTKSGAMLEADAADEDA